MNVIRRTFEAAKHPKGSEERARLNEDARTSEYMTSYRYMTVEDRPETATTIAYTDRRSWRTKRDAEAYAARAAQHGADQN